MPITFTCPNPDCRAKMTVPDKFAGKRGNCSKCKQPLTVPVGDENGAAAPAAAPAPKANPAPRSSPAAKPSPVPTPVTTRSAAHTSAPGPQPSAARTSAATPPPARPGGPAAVSPTNETPLIDAEAAAAELFSDGQAEQEKALEAVEFLCPQCDEPIKMPIDLAGKRAPCPSCRRIILVPKPESKKKDDWRDRGPNLPSGARRDDLPVPDGAWTGKATAAGYDSLKEAGVIEDKHKPATLLQRAFPYMVLGSPALLLLVGALWLWHYLATTSEARALGTALAAASTPAGQEALRTDGRIALHGMAGKYFLRKQTPGCASLAREQYTNAVAVAKNRHSLAADALLGEIALAQLELGGKPDEVDTDRKLRWSETQKIVRTTLGAISDHPARLLALRKVSDGLVQHGQVPAVRALTMQLYPSEGADRSEALATVGLELLRLGKKDEAIKAATDAEAPYAEKKNRPALSAAVVALALALERKPPESNNAIVDDEAFQSGTANGLARLGKLAEARQAVQAAAVQGGGRLRVRVALADGAASTKQADPADLEAALAAVAEGARRPELELVFLRLVELALAAGVAAEKIEPAAAAIADPQLSAWARQLIYRKQLAKSRGVEGEEGLGKLPASTLAGLMARFELARHNTEISRGWGSTVASWPEGPRALGSLGVAMGMQGEP